MNTQQRNSPGLIVLLAVISLGVGTLSAQQQHVVPPTARQAATMLAYAARLAHNNGKPISSRAKGVRPLSACSQTRRSQPQDLFYSNGAINGNTDAWTISFGFIVTDTFVVYNDNTTVTGMDFGACLFPGDTLTSAEVSITSSPARHTSTTW